MLTFGGTETFHARVDLPPPDEGRRGRRAAARASTDTSRDERLVRRLRRRRACCPRGADRGCVGAFDQAGIDVVETLRAHEGRWFAPGRPGAPAAGVPYDIGGHLFRAQAVVDGIVVHGSRAELEAVLQPSPDAVDEVARAVRRAVPSPPDEIADLVDIRLEAGRFTAVELARVLLGLLERRGARRGLGRHLPRRRGATRPSLDRCRPARPRRPGRGAGRGARAGRVAGGPRCPGLVRRRPVPGRRRRQHPGPAGGRHAHQRGVAVRLVAGGVVITCTGPQAVGTARPWTPGPSASRRSCWSSTRRRGP